MLGEFYLDDDKFQQPLSRVLFMVFTLTVLVMMLNLLIAIISDTFERVIERKAAQFTKQQALLMCQMEEHALFGYVIRRLFLSEERVEKGYLHILRPGKGEAEQGSEVQWQGRMRRLKDHTTEQVAGLKKEMHDNKKEIHDNKTAIEAMDSKIEAMDSKMGAMDSKMEAILALLNPKGE